MGFACQKGIAQDRQTPGDRWSNAAVSVGMIPVATVLFLGMDLVIHQMGAK